MSLQFNAEEILEIAAQIERNGARYYRKAAEMVTGAKERETLVELAEMEERHEIAFENMRGDPDLLSRLLGDVDGPAALYLRALASGHVFRKDDDPAKDLLPGSPVLDIYEKAISMELASIAFYQGIAQGMSARDGKEKVEGIIAEEMSHVTFLNRCIEDYLA